MTETGIYITLDSVVLDFINEANKDGDRDYARTWQLAYRGMENLGLDAFYMIQAKKLPINDNLTVTLPADYVNWTKVGILNGAGEIVPLWYNDKLTNYADIWPDRTTQTVDNTFFNSTDWANGAWCNYWNGSAYINIYGVPSGAPFVGSFKVDQVNGVILLAEPPNVSFPFNYLMLEYVSIPKQGEEYYVPVQFREALIAWIRWRDTISLPVKTHMENTNSVMRKREFYNERRNAIAQWKPVRDYDRYQVSQEMSRMAIKS